MPEGITEWKDTRYLTALSRHMEGGLRKHMQAVQARAVKSVGRFQPTKTSAKGTKRGLDPSREGEPPKVVTAQLRQSIQGSVRRLSATKIEGVLTAAIEYAARLEFGFFNKKDSLGRRYFQRPRPFLRPAIRTEQKNLMGRLRGG